MSTFNAAQVQLLDKLKKPEPPADRRKPRMYSSTNPTSSPETPYHLDFCMWLMSEDFEKNRLAHIVASGGKWLGSLSAW